MEGASLGWIGLLVSIVAAWLAFKAVKFVFKLLWWAAVLAGLYWFLAPALGLPRPFG